MVTAPAPGRRGHKAGVRGRAAGGRRAIACGWRLLSEDPHAASRRHPQAPCRRHRSSTSRVRGACRRASGCARHGACAAMHTAARAASVWDRVFGSLLTGPPGGALPRSCPTRWACAGSDVRDSGARVCCAQAPSLSSCQATLRHRPPPARPLTAVSARFRPAADVIDRPCLGFAFLNISQDVSPVCVQCISCDVGCAARDVRMQSCRLLTRRCRPASPAPAPGPTYPASGTHAARNRPASEAPLSPRRCTCCAALARPAYHLALPVPARP